MNIHDLSETYYRCLKCEKIGTHNYYNQQEEELNKNDWAEFSQFLTCDKCGNDEWVSGWIDGFGTFNTDDWEQFIEVDFEPEQEKSISTSLSIIEKGQVGELAFNDWLQSNNVSFLYIEQSEETFSTLFKNSLKRPDFLILLESIGMIAVDVKNYKKYNNSYSLNLQSELIKSLTFERLFRMPLWYAYKTDVKDKWLWISALKALEVGTIKINRKTNEQFIMIDESHFASISSNDDLGKLYTQRITNAEALQNYQV
ncbi:hypothetical protein [Pseudoalteromonas umbrosa]|uniref:hypothetical protein n=1 Tax=Pseudoalteromonas umbrosa TaxID=3048489 RepID=UPI0024C45E3B|nr:hypothetical protein [Pseudoalteromonas sp. B95]MDK1286270.1 hypothetical protein [Pseudoalteromonas sp. B95]